MAERVRADASRSLDAATYFRTSRSTLATVSRPPRKFRNNGFPHTVRLKADTTGALGATGGFGPLR